MKKKILFIVTEDWYFLSHRLKLAKFLSKKGFEIFVCCIDTGRAEEIEKNGICYFLGSYYGAAPWKNPGRIKVGFSNVVGVSAVITNV